MSDAVLSTISDTLTMVLECGDVRVVRTRRKELKIEQLSSDGKRWTPKLVMDEVEAADLNNKLDELLRQ